MGISRSLLCAVQYLRLPQPASTLTSHSFLPCCQCNLCQVMHSHAWSGPLPPFSFCTPAPLQTYSAISQAAIAAAPSPPKLVAWIQWWAPDTYGNPCSGLGGAISVNYPAYKAQLTRVRG